MGICIIRYGCTSTRRERKSAKGQSWQVYSLLETFVTTRLCRGLGIGNENPDNLARTVNGESKIESLCSESDRFCSPDA
jgi:hypothetical protein